MQEKKLHELSNLENIFFISVWLLNHTETI